MLRWTAAGAVSAPETLQIRVHPRPGSAIRLGLEPPRRAMTTAEVERALVDFSEGLRTPRSRPCRVLILSGEELLGRPDLGALLSRARELGYEELVLHVRLAELAERGLAALSPLRPRLAISLEGTEPETTIERLAGLRASSLSCATHSLLDLDGLRALPALERLLASMGLPHTFTWPLPTGGARPASAPPLTTALAQLLPVLERLRERLPGLGVKGLPACYLGPLADLVRKTANRWYVDAEHQGASALLFLPDVLAFARREACRFCARADRCDGFFDGWLDDPESPPLQPFPPDGSPEPGEPQRA